eukprot:96541_1
MTDEFMDEYDPYSENTYRKRISLNDEYILFDILDIPGRDHMEYPYHPMSDQWIKEGHFFLILFGVNNRSSFSEAVTYRERLLRINAYRSDWGYMLVGNKIDLRYDNVYNDKYFVSSEEGLQLAEEWN